jgi:glyoxylase-like metal-dependent hydrolase (beta-lactamase superfamily II)
MFLLLVLMLLVSAPAFAQGNAPTDLEGEWRRLTSHEDAHERGPGPDPGEYWGLPLNDAARMRADTYNGSWLNVSFQLQCRPHPTGYQQLGPDSMRIEKEWDPLTRQIIAYRVLFQRTPGDRMIWLDGREHPSKYAAHTWEGFSTGKWAGDTLTVTSTHLKESFIRRNGVQGSFRRSVTEHISLDEPYLTWILIVNDPDYLTEPLIRSVTFERAPNQQLPVYPCSPQLEEFSEDRKKDYVPHYTVGTNPYLTEVPVKYKVPVEGVRGGAETMYPEFQQKVKALTPPATQFVLKPEYRDDSTRVAERADAESAVAPDWGNGQVEVLHVNGNVYLLGGAGGNIAVSWGGDGALMVDTGVPQMAEKVMDAIRGLAQNDYNEQLLTQRKARPFASAWQVAHSLPPTAIRVIINTSDDPERWGGNEKIAFSRFFRPIGVEGGNQDGSELIVAHENVLQRMIATADTANPVPTRAMPTTTYFSDGYRLHRFFNGEGIEVIHVPNAHTDGDSIVYFRNSDVIVTGAIFNADTYPVIDVDRGGSIQGVIDALVRITELAYPEYMGQGGTMIVPGSGRICDVADAGYYRDMMIIVRDRVRDMINKGMTLDQVKAAKPTMDYDPLFGREKGATARFVESVYRSLMASEGKGN